MGAEEKPEATGNKKRYVRRLTEARREQNRRAQKAYRQRQIQQLQTSQQRTGHDILFRKHELALRQAFKESGSGLPTVATDESFLPQDLEVDSQSQRIHEFDELLKNTVATEMHAANQCIDYASYSPSEPKYDSAALPTTLAPAVLVPADPNVLDMRGMWPIPLKCYQQTYTLPVRPKRPSQPLSALEVRSASASLDVIRRPPTQNLRPPSPYLPDPYINQLQLLGESCFAATMAIAFSLGISRPSYINDHLSPFSLAPFVDYAHISADLQPTFEQRTLVHPVYLDCIIFPNFRSRAIELSSRGELDHCSLFLDLMHDGLVCWGSQYASAEYGRSMSDLVPWSRQSWEARPWFLKKWGFLIGEGDADSLRSISDWWSTVTGEDDVSDSTMEEVGSVFSRHGTCNVGVRQTYDDPLLW